MILPAYVGRYEVRTEIARGGFAVVVLAWDEELDSPVALKILDAVQNEDETLQRQFIEEARLLRRIRSNHVVAVHDVGRLNDGRPYFVMDLADRGTLADWLGDQSNRRNGGQSGPIKTRYLMAFVDAVADGLAAIHGSGIVHRDIKPANILFQSMRPGMVDPDATILQTEGQVADPPESAFDDSRILVGDLGIAQDVVRGGTDARLIGGTPAYQAPEQLDPDQPISMAADIFSSSAVLYHLVSGLRPPRPDRIEEFVTRLPKEWHDALLRGLSTDPEKRYTSIQSWRAAVHDVLSDIASDTTQATWREDVDAGGDAASTACPYKGLNAYQPEDSGRYYGREALTEELVRKVQAQNVLIVGGPSGCGKSSLIRAGLIPALQARARASSTEWRFALMTPGRDAVAELHYQLKQSLPDNASGISPSDLAEAPALARRIAHPEGSEPPLFLFVDQFEELFTLSPPAGRKAFVEALSAMTDPADSRVKVVLGVRADYYAACAQIPWLADRITANQTLVGPMSRAELRRAITEPARQAGLYLERSLIDTLVEDAGNEAGTLPLVAHALMETWLRRRGATLTLDGYRAAGGVAGAIAQTADTIFVDQFNDAERDIARRLFLRLVTPGEGAGDTRRIIERAELEGGPDAEATRQVVDRLTAARLLTADDRFLQITHEALLRSWPRLRGWIDEARDELRTRQRLIRHAEEWEAAGEERDLLLRGTPLLSSLDWQKRNPDQGSPLLDAFLGASVAEKKRVETAARERQQRNRRVRRIAVGVLAALALGTTAASLLAWVGYRDAQRNHERAELASEQADERFALALGAVAAGMADEDPLLATYLAGEAAAREIDMVPGYDTRAAMIKARLLLAGNGPYLLGREIPAGDALSMAMSPDGSFVAVGRRDGSILMIDTLTRRPIGAPAKGHAGGVEDVVFSPDGSFLASAGNKGGIRIWQVEDGFLDAGRTVAELGDVVWGVGIDPTGQWLASASEDRTVRLWRTDDGTEVHLQSDGRMGDMLSVAFSPDGKVVVAGVGSGEIFGWQVPEGDRLQPIEQAHSSDVWSLEFNPAGDRFVSVSSDGSSALFSFPQGQVLGRAFDGETHIESAAFAPDGDLLIGGAGDGRLYFWRLEDGLITTVSAQGHTGGIIDLAASGNGRLLASLGRDQTVRLWNHQAPKPLSLAIPVEGSAKGLAISGDGAVLAAADEAGTVHLKRPGQALEALTGHEHQVWALALSSKADRLASGDRSGRVSVRQVSSGDLLFGDDLHSGSVWWLAFNPDDSRLFAATDGGLVMLDAESGETLAEVSLEGVQATRGALSPDGTRVAVSDTDGSVRIYDTDGLKELEQVDAFDDVVWSLAFSRDGEHLAIASSDESVSLWRPSTGLSEPLTGHNGGATDLAFLSDGVTLAVTDRRGQLHLWDFTGGRRLHPPIDAHAKTSWRLAAADDGRFATTGDDGIVHLWDVLHIGSACSIGAPSFDSVRHDQYFGADDRTQACAQYTPGQGR